jgi:4a-hydroxytetrahydrobiopterin dehydratase
MWTEKENKLQRSFEFRDFMQAFTFMTRVAFISEKINHHPDWSNAWNKVHISLCTHDAGNIVTEKDRRLADLIDRIYSEFSEHQS